VHHFFRRVLEGRPASPSRLDRPKRILNQQYSWRHRLPEIGNWYFERVGHETDRYQPFVLLANYVVEQLGGNGECDLTFCCNDPTFVEGSPAKRKPDMAGVRSKSVF
jgi:hypothetical protein